MEIGKGKRDDTLILVGLWLSFHQLLKSEALNSSRDSRGSLVLLFLSHHVPVALKAPSNYLPYLPSTQNVGD